MSGKKLYPPGRYKLFFIWDYLEADCNRPLSETEKMWNEAFGSMRVKPQK
jgi:hypothetical protein